MRRRLTALVASQFLLIGVALLWASVARADTLLCNVRSLSAEHVYLGAGSISGLEVGLKGQVTRSGEVIAEIEIVFVAERSASSKVISQVQDIVAGDTVHFKVEAAPPEVTTTRRRTAGSASGGRAPAARAGPGPGADPACGVGWLCSGTTARRPRIGT